jgi:uncharacterized protein YneF (UPF0154 family)
MRLAAKIAIGVLVCAVALFAAFGLYLSRHEMKPARALESGNPKATVRVLIATQGSAFKDAVVAQVMAQLASSQAFIKVVDISSLGDVSAANWSAVLVLHTWEFGKPPQMVRDFVARQSSVRNLVVLSTSGSGRERLAGVDAVSAASVDADVPARAAEVTRRLRAILGTRGQ